MQGMEDFDDVVDWDVWMILICKKGVLEKMEKNMDDIFVLQNEGEQSCNHMKNHAKLVEKIDGGYIEIVMAAIIHEYSIIDYASKTVERKCLETYMQAKVSMVLKLLQLLHLLEMLLSSIQQVKQYT